MDVDRRTMLLGTAGVVAAAIAGGVLLGGGERATDPLDPGGALIARSEMELYREQIRQYDEEKERLLASLAFYQGNASIQETYRAVSGMAGDSPVIGSAAMISEDIIAYDERSDRGVLVARRIALLGDSVKAFDIPNIYKGTLTVKVGGVLTEYYGSGLLRAFTVDQALEGNTGYYLDFSGNPVRMDCGSEILFTDPPVKNTYWIQVIGPESVDMVATGVFTPGELPDAEVALIPGLTHLLGEKTYNSDQTMVYEYSGGSVAPQGTFSYDYQKMSYDEIKDFLAELRTEAQKDKELEAAVDSLDQAWKDAFAAEQELDTIRDASQAIQNYADRIADGSSTGGTPSIEDADLLVNGPEFRGEVYRAQDALDKAEAGDGALRKLEDFSLEGGEGDRQEAADAMGSLLPVLRAYLAGYREALIELHDSTLALRSALTKETKLSPEALLLLESIRTQAGELQAYSACIDPLAADFSGALLGLAKAESPVEAEFSVLAGVCEGWETAIRAFLPGAAPLADPEGGVAIPADYPVHIVPLPKNAVLAISEEDEEGAVMLTLKTDMERADAIQYYRDALVETPGYEEFSMGDVWTASGTKEDYEWSVMVTINQMGGSQPTLVQITLMPVE